MVQDIGNNFPAIFFCICCVVIIVPFTLLIVYLIRKSRKEAWSGVIVKRVHNQTTDIEDNTQENYYFEVKMDNGGRNRNIAVSPEMFAKAKDGDKIKKDAGKLIPELIKQ